MEEIVTDRGFKRINFTDDHVNKCSIQESSKALYPCIWFGQGASRMHLNQEQVKELLPYLDRFVETGKL
jgi:hypothetical protein